MGTFHAGELAVQERAGVRNMAKRVANGIHDEIPSAAAEFMAQQSFAIIGGTDEQGNVWASVLHGAPGFLRAVGTRTAQIQAMPQHGDPLADILARASQGHDVNIGMLVIDLATRRRMRLNGSVSLLPNGILQIQTDQVYANCPKYIQKRAWQSSNAMPATNTNASEGNSLMMEQHATITHADTFFVASASKDGSADASHRGGAPGFVQVVDENHLLWPDYAGNTMFNTLGNIATNAHAGLLFLDFETGDTLQLTGRAQIVWDAGQTAQFPGAERLGLVRDRPRRCGTWNTARSVSLIEASPFNP